MDSLYKIIKKWQWHHIVTLICYVVVILYHSDITYDKVNIYMSLRIYDIFCYGRPIITILSLTTLQDYQNKT